LVLGRDHLDRRRARDRQSRDKFPGRRDGRFLHNNDTDILWQNTNTGQASIWEMAGAPLVGGGPVSPNPGPARKAIGTGDFDADGASDILWQNTSTGQISIWEMKGTSLLGGGPVSINPGTSWQAVGTGDFNQDGHADILLQNRAPARFRFGK
jgi:hypothetical protein